MFIIKHVQRSTTDFYEAVQVQHLRKPPEKSSVTPGIIIWHKLDAPDSSRQLTTGRVFIMNEAGKTVDSIQLS